MVKQVYRVKYDGQKQSSDLNSTIKKSIILLQNLAIDGKEIRKSSIDILGAKCEPKKMRVPKIKKIVPLSKVEINPICSISLLMWQEKELWKFSAEKLKEKGLSWVPKGSIQTQKDNAQASGETNAKKRRRFKKQLSSWRFAPNHQNQLSWHHPYSLPILMWNSSPGMHGYASTPYFSPCY
jgi:hypothetical protein